MRKMICRGALALSFVAAVALAAAQPAEARSIQRDGYFGGTWSPIGPKHNRHVKRFNRRYGPGAFAYYGPRRYYGPGYYYYGPRYRGPGVSVGIGF
jgi:hypothetical protein